MAGHLGGHRNNTQSYSSPGKVVFLPHSPNESTITPKIVSLGPIKKIVSNFSFLELRGFPVVDFIQCQNNRQTWTKIIVIFFSFKHQGIFQNISMTKLLKNLLLGALSTKRKKIQTPLGGTADKNPPASAEDTGLIPFLGRFHMLQAAKPTHHNY